MSAYGGDGPAPDSDPYLHATPEFPDADALDARDEKMDPRPRLSSWRHLKNVDDVISSTSSTRSPRLRYKLVCSIGVVPGAEHVTGPLGYTDDLDLAIWVSKHSSPPYWDVYDVIDDRYVGGGSEPSREACISIEIARLIETLTQPWTIHQEVSAFARQIGTREDWLAQYPRWTPAPESIMAPLRASYYVAKAAERSAAERPYPPGRLASYGDGRDLLPGWGDLSFDERRGLEFKSYEEVVKRLRCESCDELPPQLPFPNCKCYE